MMYKAVSCAVAILLMPLLALSQDPFWDAPHEVTSETEYSFGFYVPSWEYRDHVANWEFGSDTHITRGQGDKVNDFGGVHAGFIFDYPGSAEIEVHIQDGPDGYWYVNIHPLAPAVASIQRICETGKARITMTYPSTKVPVYTCRWYDAEIGGNLVGTGSSLDVSNSSPTASYYVSTYSNGLESMVRTRVSLPVTTNASQPPSVVTPVYGIGGGTVTLHASGANSGISYIWRYADGSRISPQIANTGPTTQAIAPAASMANFASAQLNDGSCDGPKAWIEIVIYSTPVISQTGIAMGEPTTLVCNPDYELYKWYRDGVAVTAATTQNTYATNIPGVYQVEVFKGDASGKSVLFTLGAQFAGETENYIVTDIVQIKGITATSAIEDLTRGKMAQTVQYFDGLGRPVQGIITQGSPAGKDLVQPTVYDAYGRETRKYLPVALNTSDGRYKRGIIDNATGYSGIAATNVYNNGSGDKIDDSGQPYAETIFESSPLNRVLKQGAPGADWQPAAGGAYDTPLAADHSIKKAYVFNSATDVILIDYDESTKSIVRGNSTYYEANRLRVNKTKDEHNNEVIEYVDKEGHIILKQVQTVDNGVTVFAETYYVYDDLGNLVVVLPPEAMKSVKTILMQP